MTVEKIMEFVEFIKFEVGRSSEYQSNLVEIYKIKHNHLEKDFVQTFLKARQKNVVTDRYRIEIIADYTPGEENIIGEVLLMRKNKLIEKAQLITKSDVPESEKLIYWEF
jgi:hypothetical protein